MAHVFAGDVPSAVGPEECAWLAAKAALRVVLEVGSEYGRSTIAMASTARAVHSVDWHRGDDWSGRKDGLGSLPAFLENLERHGVRGKVTVHLARLEEVVHAFAPGAFEFAFLDAEHGFEPVLAGLYAARLLVGHGREIAVHDADQPQVWEAVQRFGAETGAAAERPVGTLALVREARR